MGYTRQKKQKKYRRKSKRNRKQRGGSENIDKVCIEKYIERTKKDGPTEVSGIPLDIYRTWHTDSIAINMKGVIDRSIQMSPEFNNHFFTDEDCLKFIQENFELNVANAFKCLKPGAFKSDLWRYCVLYKKGGVYFDIKMELLMELFPILEKNPLILIGNLTEFPGNPPNQIWNGFMASAPGNQIFKDCIDEIVESCKTKNKRRNALDITGPCLLWRIYHKYHETSILKSIPFLIICETTSVEYEGKPFLSQYSTYRNDQKTTQKLPHYSQMYNDNDIFDISIEFE